MLPSESYYTLNLSRRATVLTSGYSNLVNDILADQLCTPSAGKIVPDLVENRCEPTLPGAATYTNVSLSLLAARHSAASSFRSEAEFFGDHTNYAGMDR